MQLFDNKFIISGNDLQELRVINHTTTLENAIGILKKGITSNIPDVNKSKVSELKAKVIWTTPNEWKNQKSPFGCVSFDIEWRNISQDFKRVYKVEDEDLVANYQSSTYRLLFTNKVYNNESIVKPFNPKLDKGPIKFSKNKWCKIKDSSDVGHFLLETPVVSMDKISQIKFVENTKCRTMNRVKCGSAFLSYILSKNLQDLNRMFKIDGVYDGNLISYISDIKTHNLDDLPQTNVELPGNHQVLIKRFLYYYYLYFYNLSVREPRTADEYDRRACKILASIGGRKNAIDAFYSYVNRHFDFNFR